MKTKKVKIHNTEAWATVDCESGTIYSVTFATKKPTISHGYKGIIEIIKVKIIPISKKYTKTERD